MGCSSCKSSKAKVATPVPNSTGATLLDSSTEKAVDASGNPVQETNTFYACIDSVRDSSCLSETNDSTMLKVASVEGGPIGLWNNRAHTEKIKRGDIIVKARKARGEIMGEWVASNAVLMLEALLTEGPFEVLVERRAPSEQDTVDPPTLKVLVENNVEELTQDVDDDATEKPLEAVVQVTAAIENVIEELPAEVSEIPVIEDSSVSKGSCGIFAC
jgi:hypothetical protein